MADLIQLRRDTANNWTSANPVLSQGEQGYETDTGKMKIGDGSTAWASLAYFVDPSSYATSSDITTAVAPKANTADLATVATTGAYSDLTGTPTGLATETYVDTAVSNLVDTAPEALDTLNELAAALGDDANFATTTATSIGLKANTADLATVATTGAYSDLTGTPTVPTVLTDLNITDGTAGQVLSADGDGTYTFIDAASGGGGGGSFEAVASGSLSDGSTTILNADGTVSAVSVVETFAAGTAATPGTIIGSLMIPNTSTALVFLSQTGIKCAVATIDPVTNSITLGATQSVSSNWAVSNVIHPVWDPDTNKAVLFYRVSGIGLVSIAMSVSGNTVTTGSEVIIDSNTSSSPLGIIYDTNRDEFIAFGVHSDNGIHGYVGTISGTTLTFGSAIEVAGSLASNNYYYWQTYPDDIGDVEWDPIANRFFIVFRRSTNYSGYQQVIFHYSGSSDGTSFSFGSSYANSFSTSYSSDSWQGTGIRRGSIVNVGENKFVIGGKGRGGYTSNYSHSVAVYDVNPSSYAITKGSFYFPHNNVTGDSPNMSLGYNSDTGKIVASIYDNSGNAPAKVGTISGTEITFGGAILTSATSAYHYWDYNSSIERFIIGAQIVNQSNVTNITAENYAGIADAAYSNGATATIQTAGSVDDAQSGLTPGQAYYVQANGTLGLTPGTPSVFAGTAVSATSLLIGKEAPASTVAYADVTGTPTLATVATTGAYSDLTGTPTGLATETYVTTAVNNLVDTAPEALNTLNELAAALGDDANFAGTVTTSLAAKANTADLATVATSGSYNDLTDQPAGAGTFQAVASGSLPDGSIVAVKSDGTVGVVGLPGQLAGFGTVADTIGEAQGHSPHSSKAVVVSGGKIVVIYENGQTGYAIVGTISGSTITFGTPVTYESNAIANTAITYNSSLDKVAIFYCDRTTDADYTLWDAFAIVGTVSGDSISFGTRNSVRSNSWQEVFPTYDSAADRIVLFYRLSTNNYGVAQVFSMNSTTVTSVSSVYYRSGTQTLFRAAYNPFTGNHIIIYYHPDNGYITQYRVATISGNTLSFGSEYNYTGYRTQSALNWMIPGTDKLIHIWSNYSSIGGENGNVEIRVGTDTAGGSISWGNKYTIFTGPQGGQSYAAYDRTNNKGIIFFAGYNGSVWTYFYRLFTQSGNNITLESPVTITSAEYRSPGNLYGYMFDSVTGKIILDKYNDFETYQTVDTVGGVELTAENYIGISNGDYADGANATVQIVGSVDDAQTGLTPGQAYYVQPNGTLATTAADPSVFAGTAVSATKLIVKG